MKTYGGASFKNKEYIYKLSNYLETVFGKEGLVTNVVYNDYFEKYYLSIILPDDHNPDFILGLIDGIKHEHDGFLKD